VAVRPNPPRPPQRRWRRYLGPANSWRRVWLTGIGAGCALALFAAILAAAMGSGSGGSLSTKQPTVALPASSDVADSSQPPDVAPVDTPAEEPTVEQPVDVPTDTPVEEAPADTPTPEDVVPTDTPVEEIPTDVPPDAEP